MEPEIEIQRLYKYSIKPTCTLRSGFFQVSSEESTLKEWVAPLSWQMENVQHAAVLLLLSRAHSTWFTWRSNCRHNHCPCTTWYPVIGMSQQGEGMLGAEAVEKTASPTSSILQPDLVKANTDRHIPSCHWKTGSDALTWHANIVAHANHDAKLTSLFRATLKGDKFKVNGNVQESNCQQISHVGGICRNMNMSSSCCKWRDLLKVARSSVLSEL